MALAIAAANSASALSCKAPFFFDKRLVLPAQIEARLDPDQVLHTKSPFVSVCAKFRTAPASSGSNPLDVIACRGISFARLEPPRGKPGLSHPLRQKARHIGTRQSRQPVSRFCLQCRFCRWRGTHRRDAEEQSEGRHLADVKNGCHGVSEPGFSSNEKTVRITRLAGINKYFLL